MKNRLSQQQKESALTRILRVAATKTSKITLYFTAVLGISSLYPGVVLPAALSAIAGSIGVEAIGSIIDNVARNDRISNAEILAQLNKAIDQNQINKLLTKEEFFTAFSRVDRRQSEMLNRLSRIDSLLVTTFAKQADILRENSVFLVVSRRGFLTVDFPLSENPDLSLNRVMPALFHKIGLPMADSYSRNRQHHVYQNWTKLDPQIRIADLSKLAKPILVITDYPNYELLRSADSVVDVDASNLKFLRPQFAPDEETDERREYEYQVLLDLTNISDRIRLLETNPSLTRYRLEFSCPSVQRVESNGEITIADEHEIEIELHDGFPQKFPHVSITSGAVHPNISSGGDVAYLTRLETWNPRISLATICLITIELLTYQWFDLYSPFNSNSARWAKSNLRLFPLDRTSLLLTRETSNDSDH